MNSLIGYSLSKRSEIDWYSISWGSSVYKGTSRVESCFELEIIYHTYIVSWRKIFLQCHDDSFIMKIAMTTETFWLQFLVCSNQAVSFGAARRLPWTYHEHHEAILTHNFFRLFQVLARVSHTMKDKISSTFHSEDFLNAFQKMHRIVESVDFFPVRTIANSFGSFPSSSSRNVYLATLLAW